MKTFSKRPRDDERLITRSCVVCGGTRTRPHWECGGYRFVRCAVCGHVFQNPQPAFDDLTLRYDSEYFQYELDNAEQFFQLMKKGLADLRFFELEGELRGLGGFLDIGCATGALLEDFKNAGWCVQGVEVCEPAARYAIKTRGVAVHLGHIEQAPFEDGIFSAVHSSHVIEHVSDPREFLRRIFAILIPGGVLAIVTPDRSGFQAWLFGSRWRSAIADHVNLFSSRHLRSLLREAGFEVLRKCSWGGLAAGSAPPLIKRPADRLAKLLNVGDVVALLARKPRRLDNRRSFSLP